MVVSVEYEYIYIKCTFCRALLEKGVCVDTLSYNTFNNMCFMYTCQNNPDNIQVTTTWRQEHWITYAVFDDVFKLKSVVESGET